MAVARWWHRWCWLIERFGELYNTRGDCTEGGGKTVAFRRVRLPRTPAILPCTRPALPRTGRKGENSGKQEITLVACVPRFVYSRRLLVTANLVAR